MNNELGQICMKVFLTYQKNILLLSAMMGHKIPQNLTQNMTTSYNRFSAYQLQKSILSPLLHAIREIFTQFAECTCTDCK
jgi:hypothetical protein